MSETRKERPIIFSAEMVRALWFGQKTVTRRLLKPQPPVPLGFEWRYPCGQPGDRLWVKETWAPVDFLESGSALDEPVCIGYAADRTAISHERENVHALNVCAWNWDIVKWRSSTQMPRWASRLTLEIVSVRTERLHDITEDDAQREGVNVGARAWPPGDDPHRLACTRCGQRRATHSGSVYACFGGYGTVFNPNTYRGGFAQLWESINGIGSWASNPLVWRVEFRVVKP